MAQVLHLEQFRLSQEAAKSFDDDLDFCPSLTAKELSEIILASILAQKENQAKQQQQRSPNLPTTAAASTATASRAITIVDPASRTPLYLPPATTTPKTNRSGRFSGSTTPATAGLMAQSDSYFNIMPASSRQHHQHQQQHQQQQSMFNNPYGSFGYAFTAQAQQHQQQAYSMGMTSPTMASYSPPRLANRIPIVNPDNGTIVSVPEAPAASPAWHQQHFVAVR
ncbi:hypothetical protein BC939DRAFT_462073 [Gamsiella multidivaricata]|uniref:uncharacterized protein n=1 Tax=Gamsiella multidivaricata TaxID=101098 RepID=UPI00221F765E|nr:uncharacterized protein BC939DRAFT_462073 [Gamsiella multidivaricata]KAG0355877.1 hypothetical protein BGZ54_000935 [Gamsiella multidivaricata]KAI7818819.1 hypothetical protein BC939DRAFT_462073 [Gamsiella multidivaricata]